MATGELKVSYALTEELAKTRKRESETVEVTTEYRKVGNDIFFTRKSGVFILGSGKSPLTPWKEEYAMKLLSPNHHAKLTGITS